MPLVDFLLNDAYGYKTFQNMSQIFSLKCIDTTSSQKYLAHSGTASLRCSSKPQKWCIRYYQDVDLYTIQPAVSKRGQESDFLSNLFVSAEYNDVPYRRNANGSRIVLSEDVSYWQIEKADGVRDDGCYCLIPYSGNEKTKGKKGIKMYLKAASPNPMLSAFRARWKLI